MKLDGIVDLTSLQFGAENGCKVSKAKYFCVPATMADAERALGSG